MARSRYNTNVGFLDLLFLTVLVFVFLFVISFLMIRPPTKPPSVVQKAEYQVILTWDDYSKDDIDLWIHKPNGEIVYFQSKNSGLVHLERDDLGTKNDKAYRDDGTEIITHNNREVVSIRGKVPGEYVVNTQFYSRQEKVRKPVEVKVELIRVNPYKIETVSRVVLEEEGAEKTMFRFTLDEEGKVKDINQIPMLFAAEVVGG